MKAAAPVKTSAAAEAAELIASSLSHRDFVGPETPTGPLPEAGSGSALEVIRSQSSLAYCWSRQAAKYRP
jgi:hypothetical protein